MRRSVSARIFAGFFVMMLAFGAVMAFAVYRMNGVRTQLERISAQSLRVTLLLGELHTYQLILQNTIADRELATERESVRRQVTYARRRRLKLLAAALKLATVDRKATDDRTEFVDTYKRLLRLRQSVQSHAPLFGRLFAQVDVDEEGATAARDALLRSERRLTRNIRRMRDELRAQVRQSADEVEEAQTQSVIAGIVLVCVALLIGIAVSFRARRTLRPLVNLVDGAKQIGRGEYANRVRIESPDELGELAQEFNSMASAIQERERRLIRSERMAAAGVLAAHITHEVRNPLNSISLNTEMLSEELSALPDRDRKEARTLCEAIRREVDRLTDITEEYLRFARLPKPSVREEHINDIVRNLLVFLRAEVERRGVTCDLNLSDNLPCVNVDENQLRQGLLNLVRNAMDAVADRGGRIEVHTLLASDQHVAIDVVDNGPGIVGERVERIFEPFYSTKDHGTGLGLALTHQIVQEHGGRIVVESGPQGTRFRVLLPAVGIEDSLSSTST